MTIPKALPFGGMKLDGNPELLVETFERYYRNQLEPIPPGAGHPGEDHKGGWITGLSNLRFYDPEAELRLEFLNAIIDQVRKPGQRLVQVMFNHMMPGANLDVHSDGPPYRERWHYVIKGKCDYWQDGLGTVKMSAGNWYGPISYWVLHSNGNPYEGERITMLVDLEPIGIKAAQ